MEEKLKLSNSLCNAVKPPEQIKQERPAVPGLYFKSSCL